MSLIQTEAWSLFGVWKDWHVFEALPEEGDALDQPAPLFEALEVCEQAKADIEDKLRQEREREAEKSKREAESRNAAGRRR